MWFPFTTDNVEAELLHTFTKVYKFDTLLLLVRLAVLTAVTLTVPIVLFPVSTQLFTALFASEPQDSFQMHTQTHTFTAKFWCVSLLVIHTSCLYSSFQTSMYKSWYTV